MGLTRSGVEQHRFFRSGPTGNTPVGSPWAPPVRSKHIEPDVGHGNAQDTDYGSGLPDLLGSRLGNRTPARQHYRLAGIGMFRSDAEDAAVVRHIDDRKALFFDPGPGV